MKVRSFRLGGLVAVPAMILGPTRSSRFPAKLAIDTGATRTVLNEELLRSLGYEVDAIPAQGSILTGNGPVAVRRLRVSTLDVCGLRFLDLDVICHPLPPMTLVDGLLGLDVLEGRRLLLDFRTHSVEID